MNHKLVFTNLLGHAYALNTISPIRDMSVDGSSIPLFQKVEDSDLVVKAAEHTYALPQEGGSLTIGSVRNTDNSPYHSDPRNILDNVLQHLKTHVFKTEEVKVFVGFETEFFLFDSLKLNPNLQEGAHYKALRIGDSREQKNDRYVYFGNKNDPLIQEFLLKYQDVLPITGYHREVAKYQSEIKMTYDTAMRSCDNLLVLKECLKHEMSLQNMMVSFMPYLIEGQNANGLHVNMSVHVNGKNIFTEPKSFDGYMQNLFRHIKIFQFFCNPTLNSYKRLNRGGEVPNRIAYCKGDRTALVKIPHVQNPQDFRFEIRLPDNSGSPHLMVAVLLMCLFLKNPGIKSKPANIASHYYEALSTIKKHKSFLVRDKLIAKEAIDKLIAHKEEEFDEYMHSVVGQFDVIRYL